MCILNANLRACFMLHADKQVLNCGVVFVKANLFLEVMMPALMSCAEVERGSAAQLSSKQNSSLRKIL